MDYRSVIFTITRVNDKKNTFKIKTTCKGFEKYNSAGVFHHSVLFSEMEYLSTEIVNKYGRSVLFEVES